MRKWNKGPWFYTVIDCLWIAMAALLIIMWIAQLVGWIAS